MRWHAFVGAVLLLVAACAIQAAQAADPGSSIRYDSRTHTWTNTSGAQTLPAVVSPVVKSAPASPRARDEFIEYTLSPPPAATRPAASPARVPAAATASQPVSPVTAVNDRLPVPAVIETWGWNNAAPNLGVNSTYGGYGYSYSPYYGYGAYTGRCLTASYAGNPALLSYAPPLMSNWGTCASTYGGGIYVMNTWSLPQTGWYGGYPYSCTPGGYGRPGGYPARPHPMHHR